MFKQRKKGVKITDQRMRVTSEVSVLKALIQPLQGEKKTKTIVTFCSNNFGLTGCIISVGSAGHPLD